MSVAQRIDEMTTWMLIEHGSRMNLVRQFLGRQARNRAHAEIRGLRRRREDEDDEVPAVKLVRDDTHALLAEHRAWNAGRARGGVRHFG